MHFIYQNIISICETPRTWTSEPLPALKGQAPARRPPRRGAGTGTLDLALRILEHLAHRSHPASLGAITKAFSASKATVYRHLQGLVQQGFVHQDQRTGMYEVGIKLVVLGEAARGRFDIVRAGRDELIALRDATRQAATVCGMVQDALVVLDLIQGHTVIEFGTRPGTRLELENSAHGKVWLAFGAGAPIERTSAVSRAPPRTTAKSTALAAEIAKIAQARLGHRAQSRSSTASMRWRRRCSTIPRASSARSPSSAPPSSSRRSRAASRSTRWSAPPQRISRALGWRTLIDELFAGGGYRRHVHRHRAAALRPAS